jgi:hypothetical protein
MLWILYIVILLVKKGFVSLAKSGYVSERQVSLGLESCGSGV